MAEAAYHRAPAVRLPLFYCDRHHFPLPPGHKFPLPKYRLLRERLAAEEGFRLHEARLAQPEEVRRIHTAEYLDGFLNGSLDAGLMRRIGFPWSKELVTRTLASAGSTLEAARAALECGLAGTLAGGTHHAFRGAGSGFCVFNDLAIAIADLRARSNLRRLAVIDLDVHQGDGTAAIFAGDDDVFTLSLHGRKNFPLRKQQSRLDVELEDGTDDAEYLKQLETALPAVWAFEPEFVLYQSGVDGLHSDRLGRLALTIEGLKRRDESVIEQTRMRRIPLAITLGGGYSEPIELTVEAHANTFRMAQSICNR